MQPSPTATDEPRWYRLTGNDAREAVLLVLLVAVTCLSMITVLRSSTPGHPNFWQAVTQTSLLCAFIPLFVKARFGFGYVVGIAFYTMIVGFFWASFFTVEAYDHVLARWSAVASLLLFLMPVLFQTRPFPGTLKLSIRAMDRLMLTLLAVSAAVLAFSASYGVTLVGLAQSEQWRSVFPRPAILNYVIGWLIGAVLPFAFAYFAWQRRYLPAAVAVLLIWCSYPVLLNKSVVFGVVWLLYLFVLFRLVEPKRAAVVALLIPMVPGIIAYYLIEADWIASQGRLGLGLRFLIGNINIRMFGYPSLAMNQYSDFFAHHPLTHFCQIRTIRAMIGCPYPLQIGDAMAEAYNMGSMNGSLFVTEGIASVGPIWAPLSALVCGLILSLGNSVSSRLSAPVLATSAGLAVAQSLLNVPLSVSLLSNGLLVLWLLWAVSPPMRPEGQA
jgi:hypothetical protein